MAVFPPQDLAMRTEAEKGTGDVQDLSMRTEDEKESGAPPAARTLWSKPVNPSGMI
jgi:hypothetical protein